MDATREAWLQAAVLGLRPDFEPIAPLPDNLHVSVGFPSRGGLSQKGSKTIGECWNGCCSADVLVHELIHAALPKGTGHKGPFKRAMLALGLTGKPTATTAGPELTERLNGLLSEIGPYPHPALTHQNTAKKQTTRMLKALCPLCGYTIRLTQKWAEVGMPTCPCPAGAEMELDS
jgi:hypothetical protein